MRMHTGPDSEGVCHAHVFGLQPRGNQILVKALKQIHLRNTALTLWREDGEVRLEMNEGLWLALLVLLPNIQTSVLEEP